MGLKYHASNRLENLVQELAQVVSQPLSSPLAGEIILVQSRGMGRWVSLQLAEITGICMNCQFPFPRAFIAGILKEYFPEGDLDQQFSAEAMAWTINSLLPALVNRESFAIVRNYLQDDDGLKRFQLSQKIANLFDQYLLYRPEMILAWEQRQPHELPAGQEWQPELWRALVGNTPSMHLARIGAELEERLATVPESFELPQRISIFGISSLPPLYLRVIFGLAQHCEVNLFEVNPSQEYFGDDITPKLRAKLGLSQDDPSPSGNPLLTSLGRLNRDSIEVRLELDERSGFIVEEQPAQFVSPSEDVLLHQLQEDLLNARVSQNSQDPLVGNDASLRLHSCHSPMRELEVLYDQLLERFAADPTLKPRDILVMTPKIDEYSPFIEAVFGFPEAPERKIPFSIADRRPSSSSPVIESFLALLALPGGRFTAPEILAILDREPVRQRFGFTEEEIELFRKWITGANIRWGIDGAHRAELNLPGLEANTWRAGIQRLLLGFAMAGQNTTLFESILPYDQIEGSSGEILGRFITAVEALIEVATALPGERPLSQWPGQFEELLARFFPTDSLQPIRVALEKLRQTARWLDQDPLVDFHVIRYYLAQLLDQSEQRGGFLTGAVTFCALQPMRSIPARVIALIGMGDQSFPRPAAVQGFDLMAAKRKCGDRCPREDDRYTFLEALNSARDLLYISYVGRSIVHNTEIPPSVLVSELCDYLDHAFAFPEGKTARQFLTTHHRLHAFSPRYFDGIHPSLFSYSEANARAAGNANANQEPADFFRGEIASPSPEMRIVNLRSLIRFFDNPCRYFLQNRLGMRMEQDEELFLETEPFAFEAAYFLKQELVANGLARRPFGTEQLAARGLLPLGEVGKAGFQTLKKEADAFREKVEQELESAEPLEPLLVDLALGPFRLTGEIDGLFGNRGSSANGQLGSIGNAENPKGDADRGANPFQNSQNSQNSQGSVRKLQYRCAKRKAKDLLRAWITHLALCSCEPADSGQHCQTILIDTEKVTEFGPTEDPRVALSALLEIYWQGLHRPLAFFPVSAAAYTEALLKGESPEGALNKARQKWNGSAFAKGEKPEKEDPYHAFCFGEGDPLTEEFESLAEGIFTPILV